MLADIKEILFLKNIRFKENKTLDTNLNGHPVLIIYKTNTHFYYLTLSSSTKKGNQLYKDEYYLLKRNKSNDLKVPISFVNLKSIYKRECGPYTPRGYINSHDFDNIIELLIKYQEEIHEDPLYDEIKESIKNRKKQKI